MYVLVGFTLILSLDIVFAAGIGEPCTTPNTESAHCTSIHSCQVILDAIKTNDSDALQFAKDSQCGYDKVPLVCCGSSGYPIFSLFTEAQVTTTTTTEVPKPSPIPLDHDINSGLPDRSICGMMGNSQFRVLGGTVTDLDEFPWMAALEFKNTRNGENAGIRCGGSIINDRFVMTAAHCLLDVEFEVIKVWLGEWKISTDPDCDDGFCADEVQKFEIEEQIPHPFYSKRSGDNDIGLLKLKETIKYSDFIRPICLPPPNLASPPVGTRFTVCGWGATENGTSSDIKLKVELPLISNEECNAKFKHQISANQVCAGGEMGKDTCQGDSGGPLMRTYGNDPISQNQWYQEGVVAYGVGCGHSGFPAIYVRVTRYIKWIINNTKEK